MTIEERDKIPDIERIKLFCLNTARNLCDELSDIEVEGDKVYEAAKTNATLPPTTPYEGYIKVSLALLSICDEIYMLDGWEDSKGAKLEYAYAVAMGKKILRESED